MSYKCISLDEAQILLDNPDTVIIDIRDQGSYKDGNIPRSINNLKFYASAIINSSSESHSLPNNVISPDCEYN